MGQDAEILRRPSFMGLAITGARVQGHRNRTAQRSEKGGHLPGTRQRWERKVQRKCAHLKRAQKLEILLDPIQVWGRGLHAQRIQQVASLAGARPIESQATFRAAESTHKGALGAPLEIDRKARIEAPQA
jgi:hypothetical protein